MDRLETLAPELVRQLTNASPTRQRATAIVAAEFALERTGLRSRVIDESRRSLQAVGQVSAAERTALEQLRANLDSEYFQLQEAAERREAGSEEYLRKFAQARAVSALLFASMTNPFEASAEAIYEAAAALDDKRPLFAAVESALKTSPEQ
jgi:hypothetical protein